MLEDGTDFDTVILGCSVGVFPYIAKELIDESAPFANMVNTLRTTQTQAAQLWMSTDLAGLGWTLPSPVLDGYAEPMDTWADMTTSFDREDWPAGATPKNLAYLCSPLPDDGAAAAAHASTAGREKQNARVKANALSWLDGRAGGLWPGQVPPGNPNGLDYQMLVAPGSTLQGAARFDTQYWLATMNPQRSLRARVSGQRQRAVSARRARVLRTSTWPATT